LFYKIIFMVKDLSDTTKPLGLAYLVGRLDHVLGKRLRDCCAPARRPA
jgi:hypothetical protein